MFVHREFISSDKHFPFPACNEIGGITRDFNSGNRRNRFLDPIFHIKRDLTSNFLLKLTELYLRKILQRVFSLTSSRHEDSKCPLGISDKFLRCFPRARKKGREEEEEACLTFLAGQRPADQKEKIKKKKRKRKRKERRILFEQQNSPPRTVINFAGRARWTVKDVDLVWIWIAPISLTFIPGASVCPLIGQDCRPLYALSPRRFNSDPRSGQILKGDRDRSSPLDNWQPRIKACSLLAPLSSCRDSSSSGSDSGLLNPRQSIKNGFNWGRRS